MWGRKRNHLEEPETGKYIDDLFENEALSFQKQFREELKELDSKDPPFPECLNYENAIEWVDYFISSRLFYITANESLAFVWGHWRYEYPIPIGRMAILKWAYTDGIDFTREELNLLPPALVENEDAILGWADLAESKKAKCWILGLVEPILDRTDENLTSAERWKAMFIPAYQFSESMLLYEGEPDLELFQRAQSRKRFFDENVLGKKIRGRPHVLPNGFIDRVKEAIRLDRNITQEKLAEFLDCDISTVKRNVRKAGFETYRDFIDNLTS